MSRRYAARVDANQEQVVRALRACGVWVCSTAALGNGFPDLLAWRDGFHLLEVKDGSLSPSRRQLTPAEEAFHLGCPGPVSVVLSPADALAALGLARSG